MNNIIYFIEFFILLFVTGFVFDFIEKLCAAAVIRVKISERRGRKLVV